MRNLLLKIGVCGFLAAILATLIISLVLGYEKIVWPTIFVTYPALILIGASVGLGDFAEFFRYLKASESSRPDVLSLVFVLGRGLVFVGILIVFLTLEIRLIASVLPGS